LNKDCVKNTVYDESPCYVDYFYLLANV